MKGKCFCFYFEVRFQEPPQPLLEESPIRKSLSLFRPELVEEASTTDCEHSGEPSIRNSFAPSPHQKVHLMLSDGMRMHLCKLLVEI